MLFQHQLLIKDVIANAPGKQRCFVWPWASWLGHVNIITSGERSLEPEDKLLAFFISFVVVKNPTNQKSPNNQPQNKENKTHTLPTN